MARTYVRVASFIAATLFFVSCAIPGVTHDDVQVELQGFDSVAATQERYVWCWAACAEMVLRYQGEPASQQAIVERIHGHDDEGELKVETATRYELYRALSPQTEVSDFDLLWTGIKDQLAAELEALGANIDQALADGHTPDAPSGVEVSFDGSVLVNDAIDRLAPSRAVPIDALIAGEPVVAGLRDDPTAKTGHLYVVIGAEYLTPKEWSEKLPTAGKNMAKQLEANFQKRIDDSIPSEASMQRAENLASRFGESKHRIQRLELIDPFIHDDPATPINEMRVELSFEDFLKRVDFVATRADAHAILTRWTELAKLDVE